LYAGTVGIDDFDGTWPQGHTGLTPSEWYSHPATVGYVRGNESAGTSAGTQGAAMDSGTRDGTPADELARLGGIGHTSEENPTSAQPAPASRAEQQAAVPAATNASAAAANPGNAGNNDGAYGAAGGGGGGAMASGSGLDPQSGRVMNGNGAALGDAPLGSNLNSLTGIGTGGYGNSWLPFLNGLLGGYPPAVHDPPPGGNTGTYGRGGGGGGGGGINPGSQNPGGVPDDTSAAPTTPAQPPGSQISPNPAGPQTPTDKYGMPLRLEPLQPEDEKEQPAPYPKPLSLDDLMGMGRGDVPYASPSGQDADAAGWDPALGVPYGTELEPPLFEGYLWEICKAFTGYGNAINKAVNGIETAITDPVGTARGILAAASDPAGTAQAIAHDIGQKAESGTMGQAELVGDALLAIIGNKVSSSVLNELKLTNLKLPSMGGCFTRDTLVGTATGLRPIAQIEAADEVWAFDFKNGEWRLCEVECRTDSQYEGVIVTLSIGESQVTATANHPFWVIEGHGLEKRPPLGHLDTGTDRGESLSGRWVNSQDLSSGDVVFSRAKGPISVSRIAHTHGLVPVCNLTIRVLHTFAVGEAQSLVHNSTGSSLNAPPGLPAPSAPLTQAAQAAIRKINNAINDHLKPGPVGDISGTVSDMVGNPIPKPGGGYWDHVLEMQNTLRGLRKNAAALDGVTDAAAQAARQRALDAIAEAEAAIKGAGL
jgi:hypothetical protein